MKGAAIPLLVLGGIALAVVGVLTYVTKAINKKVNTTSGSWTPQGGFQGNIWDEQ